MTGPDGTGSAEGSEGADVEAAGCVVTRPGAAGGVELLLVHRGPTRERAADWSWPKGKLEAGEHPAAAAVRETAEETGVRVHLGPALPAQRYVLPDGRTKRVRYWSARLEPGQTAATPSPDEVDAVAWLAPGPARERLTHGADVDVLDDALAAGPTGGPATWPLLLLRHARAVKRVDWGGAEAERPLLDRGHLQARELAPVLDAWALRSLVTSPWARCVQTVLPFAELADLAVAEVDALTEAGHADAPSGAVAVLDGLLAGGAGALVCSHGPVLPDLQAHLAARTADRAVVAHRVLPRLGKGEVLVAHVAGRGRDAVVVAAERHRPGGR